MKPFEAIIFDCDGTLVDSEFLSNEVLAEFVAEFGLKMTSQEATELFSGGKMADSIHALERRLGKPLPESFVPEFRRRQSVALRKKLQPIDGAREMLKAMTKPFCLASNAPLDKCQLNLEVSGLTDFFDDDRIFSAYQVNSWKPEPNLFLHAAKSIGFDPTKCVVVEDSPVGVTAATAAGMQVIAFDPHDRNTWTDERVMVTRSLIQVRKLLTDSVEP